MTEGQKEILRLIEVEKLTFDQMAAALGISPRSAWERYERADNRRALAGYIRPSPETIWPPATVARLAELRAQGLSAAQIAPKLGKSRNAVCGKLFRMKKAAL